MSKYSYFSSDRAGRMHYQYSALMNGKSVVRPTEYCGVSSTIWCPKNNTIQWYWVDKDDNIRWLREHRNYGAIDWKGTINDMKKRSRYNRESKHFLARKYNHDIPYEIEESCVWISDNYHKIFDKFFECDYIIESQVLLGYYGCSKADKKGLNLSDALEQDVRYLKVDLDYSIDQMKKRKNIIVYKDDIKHMAKSWFYGGGQMLDLDEDLFYSIISSRINEARKIPRSMQVALERYGIPYEMWSLDSGDYGVFGFHNDIGRYETVGSMPILKEHLHHKVDTWVDRYMSEYYEI